MQLRRGQLPESSYRERLAAARLTKEICRIFLGVSEEEDRVVILSEIEGFRKITSARPSRDPSTEPVLSQVEELRMTARGLKGRLAY